MSFIEHLKHIPVNVEGNKPLLTDGRRSWLVSEGKIEIFITRVCGGEAAGGRHYLFTVEKGGLIVGADTVEAGGESYGILAVGHTDTSLMQFETKMLEGVPSGGEREDSLEAVEAWLGRWSSKRGENGLWPIENGRIDIARLLEFNTEAFKKSIGEMFTSREEEISRNRLKKERDGAHMHSGLHRLMDSLSTKKTDMFKSDIVSDDLLFKACAAVGRAKKINIMLPNRAQKGHGQSKDPLGDIARASQIRTRQIILKDKWWREDNGSLLAYKESDKSPVALIQTSPTKYVMYDPASESKTPVDSVVADSLNAKAHTFYRPLPSKEIKYKDLIKYLGAGIWKSDVAAVLMMGILGGVLGALTPVVTGIVFDKIIPDGEKALLTQVGFLLIAIAITTFSFNLTRAFAMHRIEGKTESDLQAAIWDRLLSLPVPFFKDYSAGELAGRAMGISQIRAIISGAVANTMISGIFSIFYFMLLFYYSWKLALICTLIVAIVMGISLMFGYLQIRYERQLVDINDTLSGKIFGLLSGVSKIKTSGAERRVFHNWAKDFGKVRDITYRKENLGNRMAVMNSTVNIIASAIIFYSMLKLKGINLGAGKFIAFNSAFSSFLGAMLEISAVVLQMNVIKPLYERTKPILETLPEVDQEKTDPGELEGSIEVSHVNFRYQDDGPLILDDVVMEIKKGDYVGIVGPSGSGKSTLFRLFLGFEKPESGQIYYDQQDLENIDIRAVRRQLGVVLQSGQLMYGSIFDNIVAANPGLTMDDAWRAAAMAGMEEDIRSMPMGMHTMVSESGSTLSGGQKQRLLIARAIISNPKIIYFDEATSALDNKTQKIVSESLAGLGATRIVIAHRLSTIANCNSIFVMDRGRIVEQGSYEQLYEMRGLFTELVNRQLA